MTKIISSLFVFLFALTASAQIQPQYVRPSKGKSLTIFDNQQTVAFNWSPVFDVSGFDAVQLNIIRNINVQCPGTSGGPIYAVYGSFSPTFDKYQIVSHTNAYREDITGDANYVVGNLPTYIKVLTQNVSCPAGTTTSLYVIPLAFNTSVQVSGAFPAYSTIAGPSNFYPNIVAGLGPYYTVEPFSTSAYGSIKTEPQGSFPTGALPVAVVNTVATDLSTYLFSTSCHIQNVGSEPVACALGSNAATVDSSHYGWVLKKDSSSGVAPDGDGGVKSWVNPYYVSGALSDNNLFCLSLGSGLGQVSIFCE